MNDIIQVEYEKFPELKRTTQRALQEVRKSIGKVKGQTELLKGGEWSSAGARLYYQSMDDDVFPGLKRLDASLVEMVDVLEKIQKIFQDAENQASGLFNGYSPNFLKMAKDILAKPLELIEQNLIMSPLGRQIAQEMTDFLKGGASNFDKLKFQYGLESTKAYAKSFHTGLGIIDGVIDHSIDALSGEKSFWDMKNLGMQMTSGVGQAFLATLGPVGAGIVVTDMVIQAGGAGLEMLAEPLGNALGFDGKAVAEQINHVREFISLDERMDQLVGGAFEVTGNALDKVGDFFGF